MMLFLGLPWIFPVFSRFFHDLSSKMRFFWEYPEVKAGVFFSIFGILIIIFLKNFPRHIP